MHERRAFPRREGNHRGILSCDAGRSAVTCRLVNMSEGGALVRVDAPQGLPELVSLFYDKLDEHIPEVVTAACMVVRREPRAAALKFLHVA